MAVPTAPTEAAGDKILFISYDNAGANAPALMRAYKIVTVNSTVHGEMGVYPTSGTLENGMRTTASSAAIALSSTSIPCQGLLVKADPANSGTIYVGKSDVTTDTTDATAGWPLEPGESVGVPCRNVNEVFIRASGSGFAARWLASAD